MRRPLQRWFGLQHWFIVDNATKTKILGKIPSFYLAVHATRARRRARTERRHLKRNGVYKHLTCGERASNGERFYFRARPLAHEKEAESELSFLGLLTFL